MDNETLYFIHALTEEDKCHPNPCHNNGVCTETNGQYVCTCGEGFKGVNCQGNTIVNKIQIIYYWS